MEYYFNSDLLWWRITRFCEGVYFLRLKASPTIPMTEAMNQGRYLGTYRMVAEFYKHLYRPSGLLINRYCVFVIRGITGIDT
jgi:hypothetical protein